MSHIVVFVVLEGAVRRHRHVDIAIHIPFKPSGCEAGRGHWDCDCPPRGRGLKRKGNPRHLRCGRVLFTIIQYYTSHMHTPHR